MSTRYNTGNPIESTDVRDMSDNAKNFDEFSNSMSDSFTDRFGVNRQTMEGAVRKSGFRPASFDFLTGGSLVSGDRNKAVFNPAPPGDNNWYAWQGAFPKIISPNSTPSANGGLGENAWKPVTNNVLEPTVRDSVRRSYAEAGYNLVDGSFEAGGAVTASTDVLLFKTDGKAYSWGGALPKTVTEGSTPSASGGIGVLAWTDRSGTMLRPEVVISPAHYRSVAEMVADTSVAVGKCTNSGDTNWRRVSTAAGLAGYVVVSEKVCVDDFLGFGVSITADIDLALSFGVDAYLKKIHGRILTVDAGVLYARKGQVFDVGFTTLKLRTDLANLSDILGPIFECDSNSSIINIYIDGSADVYSARLDLVSDFDLTPECHGIYTSRFYTNGGVFKRAVGAHLDEIYTNNTIRSGIVFIGDDHTFGTIDVGNSYCDHWLYSINCKNVIGDIARCYGSFREEGVVADGRAASPANGVKIKKVEIKNPSLSAYPYRNSFFRMIHARPCEATTATLLKLEIDTITVTSTDTGLALEADKKILIGDGWTGKIGSIAFDVALVKDTNGLLTSNSAEFEIDKVSVRASGPVVGDYSGIHFLNFLPCSFTKSFMKIGLYSLRTTAPMPATSFAVRNSGADVFIEEMHMMSEGIKPFKLFSTTDAISTIVGNLHSTYPIPAAFEVSGVNENKFNLGGSNLAISSASAFPQAGVNKLITLTSNQQVANFSDSCDGTSLIVIGNGTAQILNNANIKTKSGATLTLLAGTAARFTRIGAVFCEM